MRSFVFHPSAHPMAINPSMAMMACSRNYSVSLILNKKAQVSGAVSGGAASGGATSGSISISLMEVGGMESEREKANAEHEKSRT
jgi:hypothetical protein